MKCAGCKRGNGGLTLVEVLVIIGVVFILMGLLLPASTTGGKAKAVRINCASNLKQVGLAFRIWEGDNDDRFPMSLLTNQLGGPLYTDSANAYLYFQAMSNELNNPKILICPADTSHRIATNFTSDFNSSNISYFLGLDAHDTSPQAFLTGDANIATDGKLGAGLVGITTNQSVEWTKDYHNQVGNVGLADGSVQQWSSSALQRALQHTGFATNRLLFP